MTLIEHYKKVQAERKELLDKFNSASLAAEEAQERLSTLPDLQNLCRSLEEKARRAEDERNAALLAGEAKQKLLDAAQANGGNSTEAAHLREENVRLMEESKRVVERLRVQSEEIVQLQSAKIASTQALALAKEENVRLAQEATQAKAAVSQAGAQSKEEVTRLAAELAQAKTVCSLLNEEKARLADEVKQAKAAAAHAEAQSKEETNRLTAELMQAKAFVVQAKDENARLVQEVAQAKTSVSQAVVHGKEEASRLAAEASHAKAALAHAKEENARLTQESALAKSTLSQAVAQIKEENSRLVAEVKQLRAENQAKPVSGLDENEAAQLRQRLSEALEEVALQKSDLASISIKAEEARSTSLAELAAAKSKIQGLEAELSLAENARGSTSEMLTHFKNENARLTGEMMQLKADLDSRLDESQVKSLRDQLAKAEATVKTIKAELDVVAKKAQDTNAELAAARSKNQGLEAELALAHNAKGSTAEMLKHFKEENERLVGEVQRSTDLLRAQTEEHARVLALQQQQAQEARDRAVGALEESSQAEIVMLRKERGTYAELMAARDAKLTQLQHALEQSEKAGREHVASLEQKLKSEVEKKQEELLFVEERRQELAAKVTRMKEKLSELQATSHREAAAASELTERLAGLQRDKERLEQRVAQALEESAAHKKKADAQEAQLAEANEKLQQHEAAAAAAVAASAASAQKASLTSSTGDDSAAPSIAEEESKKLKVLLRMAKQHLQDYREKFNSCSQELRQERDARQRDAVLASEQHRRVEEAESALEKSRLELTALRESLATVKGRCQQLQHEQAEASERFAALRAKASALAQAGTEESRSSAEREELRVLRQELADLRQAVVELNQQNLELTTAHRRVEGARQELATVQAEAARLRREVEEQTNKAREAAHARDSDLQAARASFQKELDHKTAQLAQLEQETSSKFEELSSQLKLYRQRTKKTLEQKDLLVLQLKKRLKDAGRDDTTTEGESPSPAPVTMAAAAAAAASGNLVAREADVATGLSFEDAKEKMAQLSGAARDNARLIQMYQQRIAELERGKQGGDANIAYLKNVLLRWIENPSGENSKRLTPVLKVLLGLTDDEVKVIDANTKRSWW